MKYLKVYTGSVTGSFMGRDDGHPEQKYKMYDNLNDLLREYGTKKDEQYFRLKELSSDFLKRSGGQ